MGIGGEGTGVTVLWPMEANSAVADPGFAKGGRTMASAWSASLNGGLEAEPPAGSTPGAEPLVWGQGGEAPLKLKAFFVHFLYKKVAKVEDLSEICVKICPRV